MDDLMEENDPEALDGPLRGCRRNDDDRAEPAPGQGGADPVRGHQPHGTAETDRPRDRVHFSQDALIGNGLGEVERARHAREPQDQPEEHGGEAGYPDCAMP